MSGLRLLRLSLRVGTSFLSTYERDRSGWSFPIRLLDALTRHKNLRASSLVHRSSSLDAPVTAEKANLASGGRSSRWKGSVRKRSASGAKKCRRISYSEQTILLSSTATSHFIFSMDESELVNDEYLNILSVGNLPSPRFASTIVIVTPLLMPR